MKMVCLFDVIKLKKTDITHVVFFVKDLNHIINMNCTNYGSNVSFLKHKDWQ